MNYTDSRWRGELGAADRYIQLVRLVLSKLLHFFGNAIALDLDRCLARFGSQVAQRNSTLAR